jgi:predicted DNA-binding transcriptional regulator AlpA
MQGVSIIETATLEALISEVRDLKDFVAKTASELSDAKKPYLTAQEVMELTGFSIDWVNDHKQDIGYSNIGRTIRFKRKDVEAYMDQNYFKTKSPRRK